MTRESCTNQLVTLDYCTYDLSGSDESPAEQVSTETQLLRSLAWLPLLEQSRILGISKFRVPQESKQSLQIHQSRVRLSKRKTRLLCSLRLIGRRASSRFRRLQRSLSKHTIHQLFLGIQSCKESLLIRLCIGLDNFIFMSSMNGLQFSLMTLFYLNEFSLVTLFKLCFKILKFQLQQLELHLLQFILESG